MDTVVPFAPRQKPAAKQYCYQCTCESQTFVLRSDARIECAQCEAIIQPLMWGQYFVSATGIETGPLPETPP